MNTCVENTQEMPEKLGENEMQLESASDLLILDIEKNQNEGTVVHTRYGEEEGRLYKSNFIESKDFFYLYGKVISTGVVI